MKNFSDIVVFFIIVSALLLGLVAFVMMMLYLYRKRQIAFLQNLEQMKLDHEKAQLSTQLEIQEKTFQHISREIHDNITLSLTLAKLQLNTLCNDETAPSEKVKSAVTLLTKSIDDLRDISKGLSGHIIEQGFMQALAVELQHIKQAGLFALDSTVSGQPVFLNAEKELIVFRIIQEGFNNIIRHAEAKRAQLSLHFNRSRLYITIADDGKGFEIVSPLKIDSAGLKNMEARAKVLGGTMEVNSRPGNGTLLYFNIPIA